MKFREKKSIVIDATQFFSDKPDTHEHVNYSGPTANGQVKSSLDNKYWIQTIGGPMVVSDGDWITTDVDGKHYRYKPDIFEKIYEKAEQYTVESRVWRRANWTFEFVNGWRFVAVGLGLVAGFAAMAWIFGDSEAMKAWFEKPLRDASIKDVAVLLFAAAIVAK